MQSVLNYWRKQHSRPDPKQLMIHYFI